MNAQTPDEATRDAVISCLGDWLRAKIERNYTQEVGDAYSRYLAEQIRGNDLAGAHIIHHDTLATVTSQEYVLREWPRNLAVLCQEIVTIRQEAQTQNLTIAGFTRSLYEERIAPFIEYGQTLMSLVDTLASKVSVSLDTPVQDQEIDDLLINKFQTFSAFTTHFQNFEKLRGVVQATRAEQTGFSTSVIEGIKCRNTFVHTYIPTLYAEVFRNLKEKFDALTGCAPHAASL